jgi:putative photosynthetic complex assembly protein
VLAEARLQFVDRPDGAVDVFSEGVSRRVATLAPGTNGFIRGVLRGMVRERRLRSVPADARSAFILRSRRDGSLSIEDSATGRAIDLRAFGPTNAGAFARLLAAAEASDGQRFAVARAVPP